VNNFTTDFKNEMSVIKEEISKGIVRSKCETFRCEAITDEEGNKTGFIIEGLAFPLGKTSRNGIKYRDKSIKDKYKTFNGVPSLFNHNMDSSIGHIEKVWMESDGMYYRMNIDLAESDLIRKIERGDIKFVSVQTLVENEQFNENSGLFEVDVKEGLEISVVTIAGFADTTVQLAESIKGGNLPKVNKEEADTKPEDKTKPVEKPAGNESDVQTDAGNDSTETSQESLSLETISKGQEMINSKLETIISLLEKNKDNKDTEKDDDSDDADSDSDEADDEDNKKKKDKENLNVDTSTAGKRESVDNTASSVIAEAKKKEKKELKSSDITKINNLL